MSLTFGSVCSGIEAASAAWLPLGWRCAFMSEIEAFPRAVLRHHYPETPLHGDFQTIRAGEYADIAVLVGGTPCQSFSVAGLRGGLDDHRGNLALEYLRLADRLRPRWLVWENVPGVLSSNGGRDFGAILGGMVELGYGIAYRVLDAQFFGVAQRRRRVFVVGHLGDWRRAAAVLFERHSLSGDSAPRRETGQGAPLSPSLRARANSSHRADSQAFIPDVGYALNAHGGRQDAESETLIAPPLTHNPYGDHESREGLLVAHSLRGEGFDASEDGTGRGTPLVPVAYRTSGNCGAWETGERTDALTAATDPNSHVIAFSSKDHGADAESNLSPTLRAGGHDGSHANAGVPPAIAFALRGREGGAMPEVGDGDVSALRAASGGSSRDYVAFSITPSNSNKDYNAREVEKAQALTSGGNRPSARGGDLIAGQTGEGAGLLRSEVGVSAVRRLTPRLRECERLQGFPDNFTLIPWRKGLAPDGPRYKALGNSFAVPVVAWIGRRIAAVDAIPAPLSVRLADDKSPDETPGMSQNPSLETL